MPMPKPKDGESQNEFVSRCMGNGVMNDEYPDDKQRAAVCHTQWREAKSMTPNQKLLAAIRQRSNKKTAFGRGIITADCYVETMANAVGLDVCYKHLSTRQQSFDDLVQKAGKTLVYSNDNMALEKAQSSGDFKEMMKGAPKGVELPKNTLMVFRHKLTTTNEDRDEDILHSNGMEVDPNMLLLWQHVHTLPLGPYLYTHDQNDKSLSVVSAIVDMNKTTHDAAVMVDNGMGRFSHGFRALDFDKRKNHKGEETGGFEIHRAEIMEESLVSVPANPDAQTEEVMLSLIEGGKLTSPLMKQVGSTLRARRKTQVAVPGIKFRERMGSYRREIHCDSLSDLKAAADAGLIGVTEEGNGHENKSGTGEGTERKEAGADTPKEADADRRKAEENAKDDTGDEEVKCPKCGSTDIKDGKCQKCGAELPKEGGKDSEPNGEKALSGSYEQLGHDVLKLVEDKLDKSDTYCYLVATFPDSIIYCASEMGPMDSKLFRIGWSRDADGSLTLVGDPKEVEISEVVRPAPGEYEKAGRVISKANEKLLREALDDLKEAKGMDITRPVKALLTTASSSLSKVLSSLGSDGESAETEITVKDAMALVVAEATNKQRKALQQLLGTMDEVEQKTQRAERFRVLTRRDGRGGP